MGLSLYAFLCGPVMNLNNVPDHKRGAPLPTAVGVTAKVSTYHRDVPASVLGVAHNIVPQVPQHVWQVGGGHLGTWRAVAHVSVSKQHNVNESQADLFEPSRLDTIVTSPVPAPSSITFLSARLYLSWLVSRKWHNTMACFGGGGGWTELGWVKAVVAVSWPQILNNCTWAPERTEGQRTAP